MQTVMIKPLDAAWFYVEKREAPAHFGPLMILSPPAGAGPSFVRDLVESWRLCRTFAPPFNYVLRRSRIPVWNVMPDSEVELDYHFRHSALPAPGGERELGILVSRLQSHRLDRSRPLWEVHVIEGLECGRFAIYMKLHHGQLDGVGSARLVSRMFSTNPDVRGLRPPWSVGMKVEDRRKPHQTAAPSRVSGRDRLRGVLSSVTPALKALADMGREAYLDKHPDVAAPFQAPRTMLNGRIGSSRRFATQRYELARFKAVAKKAQVTVNDVFLSISAGALRRYLLEQSALPEASLTGQVPVNLRSAEDDSVGNAIAFICARLHTEMVDPVERLAAIHRSIEAGKSRQESLGKKSVESFTVLMLGPYMAQLIMDLGGYMRPAMNLVISNVPGPRERLYFNGARVDHIYGPSVLFHGQALNITMSSYVDEINISYTGCRDSLPSMQKLAVYTGEALDELQAALERKAEAIRPPLARRGRAKA
jgi:WS/DGAT/MGAT family acyltransferase